MGFPKCVLEKKRLIKFFLTKSQNKRNNNTGRYFKNG